MHVSLPAVPEQIQVARRIVRKELAGLGWPDAKIAACEEVAAQLAQHAMGVVGVSGYYLGVTKRPAGPGGESVAIRVSVTILDGPPERDVPDDVATVPAQAGPVESDAPDALDADCLRLAEVLTKRCGAPVNVVAQQGSWAASATLPAEVPCLSAQP
ncbi:hypothetical protein [Streptomyces niveus]|uniref:Histidine kinase/HSP90-like ATPase domain-containing protein n=1 Tax=Streptomyces niveus TaxID=193462 RepID=A0ABZ2A4P4_STRNV|nr:hypothetical protein [Streptomyces niveus]WTA60534.1 hypothetical protein OG211_19700 [Streptomyces niveus]